MESTSIYSEIKKLNLKDLKALLKNVKLYKDLTSKLGVRGRGIFNRGLTGENDLRVEYFNSISEDLAYEKAKVVYEKLFSLSVNKKEIKFISSSDVHGGIKVYCNDLMVDLSFLKVEKFIKE